MPTYRLTVAYDGTDFCGWQRQDNGASVQAALEEALSRLCQVPVSCRAAGRTDAGVHALGQVVSFKLPERAGGRGPLPLRALVFGTNHHLPPSISVQDAQLVPDDFDARHSASGKMYRYQLWTAPTPSPLHRRTHWHVPVALDLAAMREAAAVLTGRHDFRAFRAADCERKTTVRWIKRLSVLRPGLGPGPVDGEPALHLEVEATAFLKNMVRILVGTLVQVGKGKMSIEQVHGLLATGDRTQAGPTAPAHGLLLVRVDYGPREGP
jgi:tRNA pseudouridine38-40 synthase